ncbi:MAG: hypothetical protein JWL83_2211, partial [Actinomycetia bacterium]|nr:hypothetical protein [Actinomycetes bacterium]
MHRRGHPFRLLVAGVVGAVFAILGVATAGAAGAEQITRERVDLTIQRDGLLHVVETIDYDFGPVPHHGIIRDVPIQVHYDSKFDRRFPIRVVSVNGSAGTPIQFRASTKGAWTSIKIGDPNRTITGVHTYRIAYDVRGAMTAFRDHDELFWNTLGSRWTVSRNNASVVVRAPARITRVLCYSGPVQSQNACDRAGARGAVARFADTAVYPGEELSVVVGLPRGTIQPTPRPILHERWALDRAFSVTPATAGTTVGALALLLLLAGTVMWRVGRDRRYAGSAVDVAFGSADGADQRVRPFEDRDSPVEFTPPDNLRPGQIGTLIDECANPLDVTATIVDLAVRGYLVIEEIPKQGWFGKPDWKLLRKKDGDGLLEYERVLFDALFSGRTEVTLSDLRQTFADDLHRVEEKLYDDVVNQGWFFGRPNYVRGVWTAIGVLVVVLGLGATILAAAFTHWGLVPIPLFITGVVLVAGAHNMPRRTAKGHGTLRRVFGFREFIDQSEKERARFAEQKNLFSEYLPYAIVFGCVHKWAKAFEGLADQAPDNLGWYQSSQPFSTFVFADAIDG